jgi:PKD repeat protein
MPFRLSLRFAKLAASRSVSLPASLVTAFAVAGVTAASASCSSNGATGDAADAIADVSDGASATDASNASDASDTSEGAADAPGDGGTDATSDGASDGDATPVKHGGFSVLGGVKAPVTFFFAADAALGAGDPSMLTSKFAWDFGDAGSRWNQLVGWNVAHTFDAAGTYTITLAVTDASGATTLYQQAISVSPDTRALIYVSSAGDDANDGHDEAHAIASISRLNALLSASGAGPTDVRFRRGDTFTASAPIDLKTFHSVIGAYGTGASPILSHPTGAAIAGCAGGDASAPFIITESDDALVEDLAFDVPGRASDAELCGMPDVVDAKATGTSLRNLTLLNVGRGVVPGAPRTGVALIDVAAPLVGGLRGALALPNGSDWAIVGAQIANATREPAIVASQVSRLSILETQLAALDRRPAPAGPCIAGDAGALGGCDPGAVPIAPLLVAAASAVYLRHDTIVGSFAFGAQLGVVEASTLRVQDELVALGRYAPAITLASAGEAGVNADQVVVRNVIAEDVASLVSIADPGVVGTHVRVSLWNDTAVSLHGPLLDAATTNLAAGDLALANNLVTGSPSPNVRLGAATMLRGASHDTWSLDGFVVGGSALVLTDWSKLAGVTGESIEALAFAADAGFAPPSSAMAAHDALPVAGVWEDFFGAPRPLTGWSAGAVQAK